MGIEGEKIDRSRRKFIVGAAAAGTTALMGGLLSRPFSKLRANEETAQPLELEVHAIGNKRVFDAEPHPKRYAMGPLAGKRFSGLLSDYTIGEERTIREHESIDFNYRQVQLWKEKLEWVNKKTPDAFPRVLEAARALLSTYDVSRATRYTLGRYRELANVAIEDVRADLPLQNITHLAAFRGFGAGQRALLTHMESTIDADDLLAYALTELMPTAGSDAIVGAQTLDFLLQNAGMEFVDRIPAEFDSRVSIGPYQFTSDALYEKGNDHHGASLIQLLMKERHIPANVLQLEGAQHHKAAYLFAVYNLSLLIRQLGEHRSRELLEKRELLSGRLVTQYIATAHHMPANAIRAFDSYARAALHPSHHRHPAHEKAHAEPTFVAACEENGVGDYCQKTLDNIAGLRQQFEEKDDSIGALIAQN